MGVNPCVDHRVANCLPPGYLKYSAHRRHCFTRLRVEASADLGGVYTLGQTREHAAAKGLITAQEQLLGMTPDYPHGTPGHLSPISLQGPCGGRFTPCYRGTTPDRADDTHLGQASLPPNHNHRARHNTGYSATTPKQPPNSTASAQNC